MSEQKHLILIGMNHNTAHVEVRERYSLAPFCTPTFCLRTEHFSDICSELFLISTCNRVELLALTSNIEQKDALLERWAQIKGQDYEDLVSHVFVYTNVEAIQHLFAVASSLDSLVIGEPQILGQLKKSYKQCVDAKNVGSITTRLLHNAFSVAKRVRTETALASSAVSISYAAVELAKRIFDNMSEHSALIIGAGEMAELAALHLQQVGLENIYVANRTFENAKELATRFDGIPIPFEEIKDYLAKVDIIISSTGASHAILCAEDIKPIMKVRRNKAMFFIDIAMPRDIDPDVNTIDNVYLYDIDDLKEVVEENMAQRKLEAEKAWNIVYEETKLFHRWLESLEIQPTIIALNERTEQIIMQEFEKTMKKLNSVSEEDKEALERMLKSVAKKLNHAPLTYLKKHHSLNTGMANIKNIFELD